MILMRLIPILIAVAGVYFIVRWTLKSLANLEDVTPDTDTKLESRRQELADLNRRAEKARSYKKEIKKSPDQLEQEIEDYLN